MKSSNANMMARFSYSTSGSEHDSNNNSLTNNSNSNSLSFLIHEFFETEYEEDRNESSFPSDSETDPSVSAPDRAKQAAEEIGTLLKKPRKRRDPFRHRLHSDVKNVIEDLAPVNNKAANRSVLNRAVMNRLRELGYDSGVCKARWEGKKGLAPGNYEYVDVVRTVENGEKERYIVDVNFAAEAEIAGPTDEYRIVMNVVPDVAVIRQDEMKRVLRILADEAKRSLKSRGLSVPPWRKRQFLIAKWLGPYRRTTNPVPASSMEILPVGRDIKCRAVGFAPPVPQLHYKQYA